MFKRIKANIQSRRQRKWQIDGMCKMIEDLINDAYEAMSHHELSFYGVQGYIRHLPIKGLNDGYPKDLYTKVIKCLLQMWQYSIDMGYIDKDKSFMSFLEENSSLNSFKEWNKASKKCRILLHI